MSGLVANADVTSIRPALTRSASLVAGDCHASFATSHPRWLGSAATCVTWAHHSLSAAGSSSRRSTVATTSSSSSANSCHERIEAAPGATSYSSSARTDIKLSEGTVGWPRWRRTRPPTSRSGSYEAGTYHRGSRFDIGNRMRQLGVGGGQSGITNRKSRGGTNR